MKNLKFIFPLSIIYICSGYAVGSHILIQCGDQRLPAQVSNSTIRSFTLLFLFVVM